MPVSRQSLPGSEPVFNTVQPPRSRPAGSAPSAGPQNTRSNKRRPACAAKVGVQRLTSRDPDQQTGPQVRAGARVADPRRYQQPRELAAVGRPRARGTTAAREHHSCEPPTTPRASCNGTPALAHQEYFRCRRTARGVAAHTAERLRAMAIKMVIGWRIQLMVREVPDCGRLLLRAAFARSRPCVDRVRAPSRLPPRRASATLSVWSGASAGGSDRPTRPGAQLMWHGYTQLVGHGRRTGDEIG